MDGSDNDYLLKNSFPTLEREIEISKLQEATMRIVTSIRSSPVLSNTKSIESNHLIRSFFASYSRGFVSIRDEKLAAMPESQQSTQQTSHWYDRLKQSLKRNDKARESRYFQIATVDTSGKPSNRTVVYRGFLQQGGGVDQNILTFVTDRRSEKVTHISREPQVEIAWYFPVTREQYRITGIVQVVHADDSVMARERENAWKNMSDPGRQQFFWPHPGLERSGDEEPYTTKEYPGKDSPVSPEFCLCCVHTLRVDHLNLKANERFEYSRHNISDNSWTKIRVNP